MAYNFSAILNTKLIPKRLHVAVKLLQTVLLLALLLLEIKITHFKGICFMYFTWEGARDEPFRKLLLKGYSVISKVEMKFCL